MGFPTNLGQSEHGSHFFTKSVTVEKSSASVFEYLMNPFHGEDGCIYVLLKRASSYSISIVERSQLKGRQATFFISLIVFMHGMVWYSHIHMLWFSCKC